MLDPLNLSRGFRIGGPGANSTSIATTQNPLAGNLLQAPQQPENIERQYFYNKDLNKLFNMSGGARMAAPKGFESVNKNQYEDFASKGATLQGYSMFNDAMGGGYNLDLPRLTSGPNSGGLDRNSPEFLYYHGDDQKQKLLGNLSLEGGTLNNFPGNPNRKPGDPGNLGPGGIVSLAPTENPINTPESNATGSMSVSPYLNNSFGSPLTGGINSLSEFGKPPSLGGNNSFGNPFMGNTLGGNDNQGMSNYIDNLINQRMKDIFGGIMGIFK